MSRPEDFSAVIALTERVRVFLDGDAARLQDAVETGKSFDVGGVQIGYGLQDAEGRQGIVKNIARFRDPLKVIVDNDLDLGSADDRRKIRMAIRDLYSGDMPSFLRQLPEAQIFQNFIDDDTNKQAMRTLYAVAHGDAREFDNLHFGDVAHGSKPTEPSSPRRNNVVVIKPRVPRKITRGEFWGVIGAALGLTAAGGYGVKKYLDSEDLEFPLGRETVEMARGTTTLNEVQWSYVEAIEKLPNKPALIQEVEKKPMSIKVPVLARTYMNALNHNNYALAEALIKNSPTLPKIAFVYMINSQNSKDYKTLADEGFEATIGASKGTVSATPRPGWSDKLNPPETYPEIQR